MPQLIDSLYYEISAKDDGFRQAMAAARVQAREFAASLHELEKAERRETAAANDATAAARANARAEAERANAIQMAANRQREAAQRTGTAIGGLGKTTGDTTSKLGGLGSALGSVAGRTLGWIAVLETARRQLLGSLDDADAFDKSVRRLGAASRLLDIPIDRLKALAAVATNEFRVAKTDANEFAAVFSTFAKSAGDIELATPSLRAFLDLGAARGLTTAETLLAVQQALRGIDEGTDKLFAGKNPSVLWKEYADSIGRTVGSLTEAEQKLAVLKAGLRDGAIVQGEAAKAANSSAGEYAKFKQELVLLRTDLGKILQPVRDLGIELLRLPLLPVTFLLKGVAEAIALIGNNATESQKKTGGFIAGAFRNAIAPKAPAGAKPGPADIQAKGSREEGEKQIDNLGRLITLGIANNKQTATARQLIRDYTEALKASNLTEEQRVALAEQRKSLEDALASVATRRKKADADAAKTAEELAKKQKESADAVRQLTRELAVMQAWVVNKTFGRFVALTEELRDDLAALPEDVRKGFAALVQNVSEARLDDFAIKVTAELDFPDTIAPSELAGIKSEIINQLAEAFRAGPEAALEAIREIEAGLKDIRDGGDPGKYMAGVAASRTKAIKEQKTAAEESLGLLREQSRVIGDAARGALQIADAFGKVSDNTRSILDGLISIGTSIGPLLKVLELMKTKDDAGKPLAGATQLIGAALPVIGGVASLIGGLFGPSPEAQERKKREEENTAAIRALTLEINDFSKVTSGGRAFSAGRGNLTNQDLLTNTLRGRAGDFAGLGRFVSGKDALNESEFKKFGLTLAEFQRLAADAGIEVAKGLPRFEDIVNVGKALQAQEFNRFAETFTGQLDKVTRGFAILGREKPAEQFGDILGVLLDPKTGAPAIFSALNGIDIGSASGAARARDILRGIFTDFENLDPNLFGGLAGEDLLNVVAQLIGLIGETPGATGLADALAALTEGFAVFGIDDPAEQAKAFLDTLDNFSPALAGLLADLDLGSQGGLTAARERIRQFYRDVKDGAVELGGEGGIAITDLVTAITYLDSAITEAAPAILTLGDQLRALGQDADALNITDARAFLAFVRDGIGAVAPEIAALLGGVDLNDVASLEAADAALGALFFNAKAGLIGLDPGDILAVQDYIRAAMRSLIDDTAQSERDAAAAAQEYQRSLEEAARAAEAAAEAERQARFARGEQGVRGLQNQFSLFDITDPAAQLRQTITLLAGASPAFAALLNGTDATTNEGRANLLETLRRFFLENPNGLESGLFSADQTLQQTLALADLVKQAGVGGEITGQSTSFAVDRTITTVQGDKIAGLLGSGNILLQEIAASTRATALALGAEGLLPPSPDGTATPSGGAGTTIIALTVNGTTLSAGTLSAATQSSIRAIAAQLVNELVFQERGV